MVIICLHEPHDGVMQESPSSINDAQSAGTVVPLLVVFFDMFPPVAASFLTGFELMPGPVPASLVRVIDLLCVSLFLRLGGLREVVVGVVVVVVVIPVEENVVCFCPVYIFSGWEIPCRFR